MPCRDLMIQTLSEVSGKPSEEVVKLLDALCKMFPKMKTNLGAQIPDEQYNEMLAQFRKEAPGILTRLEQGAQQVEDDVARAEKIHPGKVH